jgi:selT/selW/selH-like putative selenoprotein
LEAEILSEFPKAKVSLVESSGGVFEVKLDETLIFSKRELGRHAHPGEVMAMLRSRAHS